jgi:hypothetical protein
MMEGGFRLYHPNDIPLANCERLEIWYDKATQQYVKEMDANSNDHRCVTFWLRPLHAGFLNKLADELATSQRGKTKILQGKHERRRIQQAVVKIEGLLDTTGSPVEKVSEQVLDLMPGFMRDAILERVDEMNTVTEDEEGNSGSSQESTPGPQT